MSTADPAAGHERTEDVVDDEHLRIVGGEPRDGYAPGGQSRYDLTAEIAALLGDLLRVSSS